MSHTHTHRLAHTHMHIRTHTHSHLILISVWTGWSLQQWSRETGNVDHQRQSHPDPLPPVVPLAPGSGSVSWLQTELRQLHIQHQICSTTHHTLRDLLLGDTVLGSHFDVVTASALSMLVPASICASVHTSSDKCLQFTLKQQPASVWNSSFSG